MLPRLTERFEDWLRMPITYRPPDPRVVLRCLDAGCFAAAFDIIDAAFGVARPRATYDWLYRHNPRGQARCVGAFEVSTGRMVAVSVLWPWPAAHHATAIPAALSGDRATAPDWQGQGLYAVFRDFHRAHPWQGLRFSWPNAGSRRQLERQGRLAEMIGPLTRAIAVLDARQRLTRRGVPDRLSGALARAATAAQAGWQRLRVGRHGADAVTPVDRFDARFDAMTAAAMRDWTGYWFPHDAEFLNWRYREHPSEQYAAVAFNVGERVAGYAVVRLSGRTGLLMELVADPATRGAAAALLGAVLAQARAAGCDGLEAMAPSAWPHWRLLRQAGFIQPPCETVMQFIEPAKLDACSIDRCRLTPGDFDAM